MLLRILDRLEEVLIATLMALATFIIFLAVMHRYLVGIPFLSPTFQVPQPPHQEAGAWKMVVDGVELTRGP